MRKILPWQIAIFFALAGLSTAAAGLLIWLAYPHLKWAAEFRAILASLAFIVLFYLGAIACYRAVLAVLPLPSGDVPHRSRPEAIYHIHLLFFLMLFYPLMKSNLVPVPLMRLVYMALGARMGANTYSGGILFDPLFITLGANTIVGQGALLIPHVIEGERLAHYPIRVGDNVTIGANAVILSDVDIGSNAIVAIGAVVTKGTKIGEGETWGGTPARKLKSAHTTQ